MGREKDTDQAALTIEQEKEIASLNRIITDLKNSNLKVEGLEKTITENTTLINNLTIEKSALSTKVTKLTETTTSLNAKNADLAAVTIEQEKEINTLRNSTENSDITITKLNTENKEYLSKINSLNTKTADLAAA